eukprot:g22866.t1
MVADPELNSLGLLKVIQVISEQDGPGVFYDGLSTLLVRQVLFGMMKFLVFDYFADFVFDLQPVLAEKSGNGFTGGFHKLQAVEDVALD